MQGLQPPQPANQQHRKCQQPTLPLQQLQLWSLQDPAKQLAQKKHWKHPQQHQQQDPQQG
jgi:hypothetical protein